MHRKNADLIVVSTIALVAIIIVLADVESVVLRSFVGLPLILFLPGYAVTVMMLQRGLGLTERLLFSIGLSLGLVIISGLLLHLTPWGLQANTWVVMLSMMTLIASGVAFLRRRGITTMQLSQPQFPLAREVLGLGVAICIVIGAIGVARAAAEQQTGPGFTQLWLLPDAQGNPDRVRIGMFNMEHETVTYTVRLTGADTIIYTWPSVTLLPGQRWETEVVMDKNLAGIKNIRGEVYREDAPDTLYRHTSLSR